jgi:hypothetical protein
LHGAKLDSADLRHADLQHADLVGARLFRANLAGANLRGAICAVHSPRELTSKAPNWVALLCILQLARRQLAESEPRVLFARPLRPERRGSGRSNLLRNSFRSRDSFRARNLHRVVHRGPSSVGLEVLMDLGTQAQSAFLRGCGVGDDVLQRLSELRTSEPDRYYSTFISYSHQDRAFARRLHDRLQRVGVRCWLDERQMLPGDDVYNRIADGVLDNERVLLCASEHSLSSWWVNAEIEAAFARERELARVAHASVQILIPIDLDGSMFNATRSGKKFLFLQSRVAADFTRSAGFDTQIDRLRLALSGPRESPTDTALECQGHSDQRRACSAGLGWR